MAGEIVAELAGVHLVDAHFAVGTGRHEQLAVRREGDAGDELGVIVRVARPDGAVGGFVENVPLDQVGGGLTDEDVAGELARQVELWGEQNHPDGTGGAGYERLADLAKQRCKLAVATGALTWRMILDEEIAEAFAESDPVRLREELVQVAAVALNWVDCIDRRSWTA